MAKVDFKHGDILEGGYDLTVFPCSAKGTVSSATQKNINMLQVEMPKKMELGNISKLQRVEIKNSPTRHIVYAASVLNKFTNKEKVKNISRELGLLTREMPELINVEIPLLGTGAGGLHDEVSAKALVEGFEETARDGSRLTIFMFGAKRLERVVNFVSNPLAEKQYPMAAPPSIHTPLKKFYDENKGHKTAFIMMSFTKTSAHEKIENAIKEICSKHNIRALRADDREYADGLLDNVLTYVYGCDFGISVFERIISDDPNPNVSYETGYFMGLQKPLLLLKDKNLKDLQTDLVGKLYKSFDYLEPEKDLPTQIEVWLTDKGFIG